MRPSAIELRGIVVLDAVSRGAVDLGAETGPTVLTLIRHRY